MKKIISLTSIAVAIIFIGALFISNSIVSAQNSYALNLSESVATRVVTPTVTPDSSVYSATVYPTLNLVQPNPVVPGELMEIRGSGSYRVYEDGSINESALDFDLYLDDRKYSTITCYINYCSATLTVPEDLSLGLHEISVVGGSRIAFGAVLYTNTPTPAAPITTVTPTPYDQHNYPTIVTMFVAPETVECIGSYHQTCLLVRYSSDEDWQYLYSGIEGFDYEPEYTYKLLVEIIEVENPPADGSSARYKLIKIVSMNYSPVEPTSTVIPVLSCSPDSYVHDGICYPDPWTGDPQYGCFPLVDGGGACIYPPDVAVETPTPTPQYLSHALVTITVSSPITTVVIGEQITVTVSTEYLPQDCTFAFYETSLSESSLFNIVSPRVIKPGSLYANFVLEAMHPGRTKLSATQYGEDSCGVWSWAYRHSDEYLLTVVDPSHDIEQSILHEIGSERGCYYINEIIIENNIYDLSCAGSVGHSDSIRIERFEDTATARSEFVTRQENEGVTSENFRCYPAFKRETQQNPRVSTTFTWHVDNWLISIHSFHDTPYGSANSIGLSKRVYEAAIRKQMIEQCPEQSIEPQSPTVTINHPSGAPGSVFVFEGSGFAADQEIALSITGAPQMIYVQTDPDGSFVLLLMTNDWDSGTYELSLPTTSEDVNVADGNIAVTIDESLPRHERPETISDDAQPITITATAGSNNQKIFLPFLQ